MGHKQWKVTYWSNGVLTEGYVDYLQQTFTGLLPNCFENTIISIERVPTLVQ